MGCIVSIFGSCATALACSCCTGLSFACCGLVFKLTKSIATRVWYTTIFVLLSVVAWIFSNWGYDILSWVPYIGDDKNCPENSCGSYAVYKLTFPLFLFHAILAISLIGVRTSKDVRAQFNDGWWILKLPLLGLTIIGSFFIPNVFFEYYAWVAVIGAGFFIFIQLLLLIDFAYDWSESWMGKYESDPDNNKLYWWLLLGAAAVMYIFVVGLDIVMYVLFSSPAKCWYNPLVVTICLCAVIIITALSIHPKIQAINPNIGLIQAGVVSAYCTYFIWSATLSEPSECTGPFKFNGQTDYLTLIFGALFTVVSVVYASLRVGHSSTSFVSSSENKSEASYGALNKDGVFDSPETPASPQNNENATEDEETVVEDELPYLDDEFDDEVDQTSYNYTLFHLAFALGCMFVAMLLTNWSIITGSSDEPSTDMGWVSVGVKLTASAVCILLYLWTIFAPLIFPDRDWGFEKNDLY